MLENIFTSLISRYSNDQTYIDHLWDSIVKKHNKKKRYYHNLIHLEHLYQKLDPIKSEIQDWDMVLFALFYHDYVYNILKKDNEEQSADMAKKIIRSLSIQEDRAEFCSSIIHATKRHLISTNTDINYFIDADLSILGSSWQEYETYFNSVRKEYKYYPDFMYNKARIKILKHFISMPRIFKTDHFFNKLECKAKYNLQEEVNLLSEFI
ncbi:hypothetical protein [Aquimarina sp. 2201CG5-10]|uniref:HD domain-containing protein n=1 Tax=Aquimarina callyspongiae TaxID=3098150 RepID=UPI002AB386E0|nr:hypothetical protein [Aquimarina sp. 2201CG5-10]MDY8136951.1 hypothetical protein [Aquimarina sp. 2201CG5-10]